MDNREITFDFGFTAISEVELDAYQDAQEAHSKVEQAAGEAGEYHNRLNKLFNAIQPLLNNLKKDPSKDYILWPDRLSKIEAFEDMLQDIYQGK